MTYEELLAKAIERQNERDQWEQIAMKWKKLAQDRSEIIKQYEEIIKQYEEIIEKALTPR